MGVRFMRRGGKGFMLIADDFKEYGDDEDEDD